MRYFDLEKIEQNSEPLSPSEQEVRERLTHDPYERLFAKLDLDAALALLTPKQKACFVLYADGHTLEEIASALSVSLPTVHQHVTVAQRKLRKFLQAERKTL